MRVDRLADDGLVARGRELVERVVPAHLETQARLLGTLAPDEQEALAGLLRKLLLALEGHQEG